MIKEKWWKESVLRALAGQSRTLSGISDTTSAKSKPKLAVAEGQDLAEKSAENLEEAICFLFRNRYKKFSSPEDVLEFISMLAVIVSDGLLPEGQPLFRTWETKFDQTPVIRIEIEFKKFCQWFFKAVDSDAVVTAALVEKRLDGEIHPFADGCGRTAKLLAMFVLLRRGIFPPAYVLRDEYYRNIRLANWTWVKFYRSMVEASASQS
jgi:Fic family protein